MAIIPIARIFTAILAFLTAIVPTMAIVPTIAIINPVAIMFTEAVSLMLIDAIGPMRQPKWPRSRAVWKGGCIEVRSQADHGPSLRVGGAGLVVERPLCYHRRQPRGAVREIAAIAVLRRARMALSGKCRFIVSVVGK